MTEILSMTDLQIEGRTAGHWVSIVKGVDIRLRKGEILGLIGESGAGKTTIGLASMAYARSGCRISGGSILLDGRELLGSPKAFLQQVRGKRISYVAQSAAASFNPVHRLIKQYCEVPVVRRLMRFSEAKEKAVHIYSRLLMPDPEHIGYRYPHQVSGGQLQRAMVAMAMACKPDVIVFDEPTTALDVTTQIEVLAAIKKITREFNTAALYITHDLAVVAQLADRIMVLRSGKVVEENKARELISSPRERYTQELLSVRKISEISNVYNLKRSIILELKNISASYSGKIKDKILDNISFKIRKGSTVALVGESGSGKSSLARVITGVLSPFRGNVIFDGKILSSKLKHRSNETLRRIQMIYQMPDTALNPKHKIRKILGRPLEFYFNVNGAEKDRRIGGLLEMIELPRKYIDRYPNELSGGEKQRLCIARALAAKPDLIICDEPTSALDQLVAKEILTLLQSLQRELSVSCLFITHDLSTVKAIAQEIVVLLQGRVVEQGVKETIMAPPNHAYTQLLFSSVPEMDPDWLEKILEERRRNGIEMKELWWRQP